MSGTRRVVAITGAGGTLGSAISARLASEPDTDLVLSDVSHDALAATIAPLPDRDAPLETVLADVSDIEQVEAVVAHAVKQFGRLDVFAAGARTGAKPALTLAGTTQRLSVPLLPAVSGNRRIALVDATILALGGGGAATLKVFDPLFTKPGRVSGLTVAKNKQKVTVRWRAAANPSRTPLSYRVVVTKGKRTVTSRTVRALVR